jgi:hypothetical protein
MKTHKKGMKLSIKPRTIENIIVILFEICFILLAVQAVNIDDIPRMYIAITAFFMTLIPYIAERLLRISLPFGIKIMIPFALFMHTAGGIMRWYWTLSDFYYDKIAHMIGGFALGLVIFASFLAYILYSKYEMQRKTVLVLTALITFLFGLLWEIEEIAIDSVVMTTYSGGIYDSLGDMIGNIIGIILCLFVAKKWMDSVPPNKSISSLLEIDQ